MRWTAWIVAACAVFAAGAGSAQAPAKRIALIIGNADYNLDGRLDASDAGEAASQRTGHLPDLRNSLNDARDMRDELRKLGFDVSSYKENATRVDMITLLDVFGKKVREAGPEAIVFVYYSGHGMQIEGENFLLPAGAQLQGADFSQMSASAMQAILSGVATPMTLLRAQFRPREGIGVNIVVLDACRNNPWDPSRRGQGGRGRGLADQNWGLGQTLIAFSTEPGNTAYDGDPNDRNSPYTTALKAQIAAPNIDLFNMFNGVSRAVEQRTRTWRDGAQRPWINSVTVPQVCLASCATVTAERATLPYTAFPGSRTLYSTLTAEAFSQMMSSTAFEEMVSANERPRVTFAPISNNTRQSTVELANIIENYVGDGIFRVFEFSPSFTVRSSPGFGNVDYIIYTEASEHMSAERGGTNVYKFTLRLFDPRANQIVGSWTATRGYYGYYATR